MTTLSRRRFLGGLIGGAATAALAGGTINRLCADDDTNSRPPNFVIIFVDDMGYQDVGCFGSPLISTPRVDRMANEGIKFTGFYAQPVCSPSRAALLTGCYPQRVSIPTVLFPKDRTGLSPDEILISEILKTRGYATACIGKWHLGHLPQFLPTRQGFDYYYGLPYSNDMGRASLNEPPLPLMRNEEIIEQPANQDTLTRRYTEEAIKFITQNKDKPFLLYLPHTMVHVPLHISDKFRGKSKRGLYGDAVEEIDWSTGEILDTLAKLGIDNNTLVLFTSDNGPWLSQKENGGSALPLRDGKGTTYEGGVRVPCVVRWPGHIPAGAICSEAATTMDLLPTFAKLAGANTPDDRIIDGKDIWPLMSGDANAKTPHDVIFFYRNRELHAVRSGKWKMTLARPKANVSTELYDLEADISESSNLADKHPDIVKRLNELAEKCREDLGDSATGRIGKGCRPSPHSSR